MHYWNLRQTERYVRRGQQENFTSFLKINEKRRLRRLRSHLHNKPTVALPRVSQLMTTARINKNISVLLDHNKKTNDRLRHTNSERQRIVSTWINYILLTSFRYSIYALMSLTVRIKVA